MEQVVNLLELIGTVAFAAAGAMIAVDRGMDIFGVAILGLFTAVGGGAIRDVLLGITPPLSFRDPAYALTAIAVAVLMFQKPLRDRYNSHRRIYDTILLVMDSLGLGVFTVVGAQVAMSMHSNLYTAVFVGTVTGVGGGVLRDVMAGQTPFVFVKHFYASASLIGALLCGLLWPRAGEVVSMLGGAVTVIALRLLAARYHWSLPKPR